MSSNVRCQDVGFAGSWNAHSGGWHHANLPELLACTIAEATCAASWFLIIAGAGDGAGSGLFRNGSGAGPFRPARRLRRSHAYTPSTIPSDRVSVVAVAIEDAASRAFACIYLSLDEALASKRRLSEIRGRLKNRQQVFMRLRGSLPHVSFQPSGRHWMAN
jgi:hypothetical protein